MNKLKITRQVKRDFLLAVKKSLVSDLLKVKDSSRADNAKKLAQSLHAVDKRKWKTSESISIDVFRALLKLAATLADNYAQTLDERIDCMVQLELVTPRPIGRPRKKAASLSKRARGAPRKYSEIFQQGILRIAAKIRAKLEARGTGKVTDKAVCTEILRIVARADKKSETRYISENLKRYQNILSKAKKANSI